MAAIAFCQQRGQDIDLIIIGDRDHGFRVGGVGFNQDIAIQGIAINDHCAFQVLGHVFRPLPVQFHHLNPNGGVFPFQIFSQEQPNIAATDDDDAPGLLLLMSEQAQGSADMPPI